MSFSVFFPEIKRFDSKINYFKKMVLFFPEISSAGTRKNSRFNVQRRVVQIGVAKGARRIPTETYHVSINLY